MIKDPFLWIKHMSAPCHTVSKSECLECSLQMCLSHLSLLCIPELNLHCVTVFVAILRKLVWALAVRESSETELTPLFRHLGNELAKRQEQGETTEIRQISRSADHIDKLSEAPTH